jgi:hypothetical protein
MNRIFVPVLLGCTLAGAALAANPAQAQSVCGPRDDIVRHLGERYGETRQSLGLAGGRGVVELYANSESGSWTILITSPQGTACLMAAGDSFEQEPVRKVAGKPA